MKSKPICAVLFFGKMQPVKAVDAIEARRKFLKKFHKLTDEDIVDVDLIEPSHKHYLHFKQSAI